MRRKYETTPEETIIKDDIDIFYEVDMEILSEFDAEVTEIRAIGERQYFDEIEATIDDIERESFRIDYYEGYVDDDI